MEPIYCAHTDRSPEEDLSKKSFNLSDNLFESDHVWLKVISGSHLYELIYTVNIIICSGLLLRNEAFLESRQTTIDIMLQISLQAGDKNTSTVLTESMAVTGNELKLQIKFYQLHKLSCTEVNFPALGSACHSLLIGHILQGSLLVF